jgi:hypothetical protein
MELTEAKTPGPMLCSECQPGKSQWDARERQLPGAEFGAMSVSSWPVRALRGGLSSYLIRAQGRASVHRGVGMWRKSGDSVGTVAHFS